MTKIFAAVLVLFLAMNIQTTGRMFGKLIQEQN